MEVELERLVAEIPKPLKEKARKKAKDRGLDLKSLVILLLEKETSSEESTTADETEPLSHE
jgi:hypothetical protein